jgi:hypothetical protein
MLFLDTGTGTCIYSFALHSTGNPTYFKGLVSRETCINGDHWCLV